MLITFHTFAEVPSQIHLFYEHAFSALFYFHDSKKDSFSRERRSNLDIDQFRKFFSLFCLFTFYRESFEFSEDSLRRAMQEALSASGLEVDQEKLISDLTQSVCLLQKDGLHYHFSHRSFQEYFAAYCIVRVLQDHAERFLNDLFVRRSDRVLPMAFKMHPELVSRVFLVPKIKGLPTEILDTSSLTSVQVAEHIGLRVSVMFGHQGRTTFLYGARSDDDAGFGMLCRFVNSVESTHEDVLHNCLMEVIQRAEKDSAWMHSRAQSKDSKIRVIDVTLSVSSGTIRLSGGSSLSKRILQGVRVGFSAFLSKPHLRESLDRLKDFLEEIRGHEETREDAVLTVLRSGEENRTFERKSIRARI